MPRAVNEGKLQDEFKVLLERVAEDVSCATVVPAIEKTQAGWTENYHGLVRQQGAALATFHAEAQKALGNFNVEAQKALVDFRRSLQSMSAENAVAISEIKAAASRLHDAQVQTEVAREAALESTTTKLGEMQQSYWAAVAEQRRLSEQSAGVMQSSAAKMHESANTGAAQVEAARAAAAASSAKQQGEILHTYQAAVSHQRQLAEQCAAVMQSSANNMHETAAASVTQVNASIAESNMGVAALNQRYAELTSPLVAGMGFRGFLILLVIMQVVAIAVGAASIFGVTL